jgi:hypothetical protein
VRFSADVDFAAPGFYEFTEASDDAGRRGAALLIQHTAHHVKRAIRER